MERRHIPESETRLTILYALSKLGPVTSMQLLRFLVETDLMNYFAMQLNLSGMQEQGQVEAIPHPLGELLILTETGRYAMESFSGRIPVSRRQLVDGAAPAWQKRFRLEQLAPADSFALADGRTCLRLRLLEDSAPLLDVLLTLPQGTSMTFLEKRWQAAAQQVYDSITFTLSQGFDPQAQIKALPELAALGQSGTEWMLTLTDDADAPTLTLMLPLADEALARHCAAKWPEKWQELRQEMLAALKAE